MRPNGASVRIDASNASPPVISKHGVDLLAVVRLEDRRLEVVRARVGGRVGAEPLHQLALLGR